MPFDLQGHRGARGLRPENTLPSFEAAFDAGVTTVETDVHLTRDGVPVLCHDPLLSASLFESVPSQPLAVSQLTVAELRSFQANRNPNPSRFPTQQAVVSQLVERFARTRGMRPFSVPTLLDLVEFASSYAGNPGREAGKSAEQRERASRVCFDLELKRVPFHPEAIGDGFTGQSAGLLELRVLEDVLRGGILQRTSVRSFDHRSVRLLVEREPRLTGAVLVAGTAPCNPAAMALQAGAKVYCPSYEFIDADIVRSVQSCGVKVVPWTVNEASHWERLISWGVDGLTTDYPDRLACWLRARGLDF